MEDFISKLTYYGDSISDTDDEDDEEIEVEVQSIHSARAFSNPSIPDEIKDLLQMI